ncbi:putative peptidoglycan synthatase FtsI [Candidatus Fokinia solitaria]|uniref:Putative peptidoglycan synthatase FtsI n=1 Tax=Candidatus Fokinia solitaria TaxID=1802984 RepID=A0A2U8BR77_9RICK|nr:penicillin-binding protein 2 [Candidatus Fokinia solitaria]AWD32846.1 putative peptidoglycan synthatase FtsI [Candidatus Fokinia solitaria]
MLSKTQRILIALGIILAFYCAIICKLLFIAFSKHFDNHEITSRYTNKIKPPIKDRNGAILATNLHTYSIYANPQEILDINEFITKLSSFEFKDLDKKIEKHINNKSTFMWLKRHISPAEEHKIRELGLSGLYCIKDIKRFYPHSEISSHVVGYVDLDNNALAGLEKILEIPQYSEAKELYTNIDIRIQGAAHHALSNGITLNEAESGTAIVMDVTNGEILASVSIPDFNPNASQYADQDATFNKASMSVMEMGSTFKVLSMAIGLDTNSVSLNEKFHVSQPLTIGRFTITDYMMKSPIISTAQVLAYSSNIGIGTIANRFGIKQQIEYFRKFKLLEKVESDFPEVTTPLFPPLAKWNYASLITMSYGYGIAVTPLHAITALASTINGGFLISPQFIRNEKQTVKKVRVLKSDTVKKMQYLLHYVINSSATKKFAIEGYCIGGKSGTAEVLQHGKYSKNMNNGYFFSIFPCNKPKYAIYVAIRHPKKNAYNHYITTGSITAGPVAKNIILSIINIMNIQHVKGCSEIEKVLN